MCAVELDAKLANRTEMLPSVIWKWPVQDTDYIKYVY